MNKNPEELYQFRNAMLELARSVGKRPPLDEADYTFYWKKLEDIPLQIVVDALDAIGADQNFFPAVAKVRDRCRILIDERRTAAQKAAMAQCDHSPRGWKEVTVDGVTRMARCEHWTDGMAAADAIGQRLALPPATSGETTHD